VRIGILHTRLRIEERRLIEALTARGAEVVPLPESAVAFDLQGHGYQSLDLVVERCQDYTLAQTALRILEHLGVPTLNRPSTVDLCGNKALLMIKLAEAGVPTPRVEVALSTEAALEAIARLGYPVVTKPLVGGDTQLLALIEDREAAEAILEHKAMLGTDRQHVHFLQEYIAKPGRDIRVLVIGEEPLAAEYRQSDDWVTSRDRRAPHIPCPLTPEISELARRAARTFGGGIFEVDLLESPRGLLVNEVGTINSFRPFETAGIDVAGPIADYVMAVAAGQGANGGRQAANVRA
jgi:[lysine-biosynthesis-protein LysW]--L-2-aminoadipate ligase